MKDWDYIEDKISEIMIQDGPDGHSDGSGIIANFVVALLKGEEDVWWKDYKEDCEKENKKYKEWREKQNEKFKK